MVTVHPECIGRGHRMAMLERFIDAAAALDGVAFERLDAVVSRWSGQDRDDAEHRVATRRGDDGVRLRRVSSAEPGR